MSGNLQINLLSCLLEKLLFHVSEVFLLTKQCDLMCLLSQVSMDPPIKQGQTRYPFLIIQFEKDEEFVDVKLNLSE